MGLDFKSMEAKVAMSKHGFLCGTNGLESTRNVSELDAGAYTKHYAIIERCSLAT